MERKIKQLDNHIIVCGAGRVGENIAQYFSSEEAPFVVVEKNKEVVQHLKEEGMIVIEGDATIDETLEQAGIGRASSLIATLSSDSDNVFVTLSAKVLNPDIRVVARAERKESEEKLRYAGADNIVTPAVIGAYRMASITLRPQIVDFIDTIAGRKQDESLNIGEVFLHANSPLVHQTLAESQIRQVGTTIVAIRRDNRLITNPKADQVLKALDSLIAFGTPEQLEALEELAMQQDNN